MPAAGSSSKKLKSKSSRFPVARIKKIMQMDEEVGKLASATPVMISKSLECFMQMLVDETSAQARSRGSKKITPHHLKSTITSQPNFDFLLPLVENIPDPAPAAAAAGLSAGGVGGGAGPSPGAAGGKGKGRKRKTTKNDDDDDEYYGAPGGAAQGGWNGAGGYGGYGGGAGTGVGMESTNPRSLPQIGTWKRDMEGGGGTGEGGRGMFDDYEEDEDDY